MGGRVEEWMERPVASDPELTGWLKQQQAGYDRQLLRGPDSPLLMSLHGLPRSLQTRPAFVDTDSCNSVLLDTEPQNPFDRLMVAAQVRRVGSGRREGRDGGGAGLVGRRVGSFRVRLTLLFVWDFAVKVAVR